MENVRGRNSKLYVWVQELNCTTIGYSYLVKLIMSSMRKEQIHLPRELLWLKLGLQGESMWSSWIYVLIRIWQKSFVLWHLKRFWKAFQKVFEITSDLENILYGGLRGVLNNNEILEGSHGECHVCGLFSPRRRISFLQQNLKRQCQGLVFLVSEESFWLTVRNGYWKCTGILDEGHCYFIQL